MPKLNTTVDNLELKSNKVVSTSNPSTWTDAQYPSAKALLDIAHPVGSILTTATNENPAAKLGGTWELVDKAFKEKFITLATSNWTATNATLGSYSNVLLTDHTIALRLNFIATTVFENDNTVELGKLNLASCGIEQLSYAVFYNATISDLGNCSLNYRISQDGTIAVHDVLNVNGTHTMASGSDFFIHTVLPVSSNYMLPDFCDKFYWKRTA